MADGTWDSAAPGRALGQGMQHVANATMQAAQMQQQQQMHRDKLNMDAQIAQMRWGQKGEQEPSGNPEVQFAKDRATIAKLEKDYQNLTKDAADADLANGRKTYENYQKNFTDKYAQNNMNNLMNNSKVAMQAKAACDEVAGKPGEHYQFNKQLTMQNALSMLAQNDSEFSKAIMNTLSQIGEKFTNSPALIKVDPAKTTLEDMFKYIRSSSDLIGEDLTNDPEFMKGIAFLKLGLQAIETGDWNAKFLKDEYIEVGTKEGPMKVSVADALFGGPNQEINDAINKQAENANRSLENLEAGFAELNTQIAEKQKQLKESFGPDGLYVEDENGVLVERELTEADYDDELRGLLKQKEEYQDYIDEQRRAYTKYIKDLTTENTKLHDEKVQLGIESLMYSKDFTNFTGGLQTLYGSMDDKGNWRGISIYDQAMLIYMDPKYDHEIEMYNNKRKLENLALQNEISMKENALLMNDIQKVDLAANLVRRPEIAALNADSEANMAKANNLQSQSQIIQSDTSLNTAVTANELIKKNNEAVLKGDPGTSKNMMSRLNTVGRADSIAGAGKSTQSIGMNPEMGVPVQQSVGQQSANGSVAKAPTNQSDSIKFVDRGFENAKKAKTKESLLEALNNALKAIDDGKYDVHTAYRQTKEVMAALAGKDSKTFDIYTDPFVTEDPALYSVMKQLEDRVKVNTSEKHQAKEQIINYGINSLGAFVSLANNPNLADNFVTALVNRVESFVGLKLTDNSSKAIETTRDAEKILAMADKNSPMNMKIGNPGAYEPLKIGKKAIAIPDSNTFTRQDSYNTAKGFAIALHQMIDNYAYNAPESQSDRLLSRKKEIEATLKSLPVMREAALLKKENKVGDFFLHGNNDTFIGIEYSPDGDKSKDKIVMINAIKSQGLGYEAKVETMPINLAGDLLPLVPGLLKEYNSNTARNKVIEANKSFIDKALGFFK